ncbi:MAG TPA: aspartate kinase [Rectinemataceae bacterium]
MAVLVMKFGAEALAEPGRILASASIAAKAADRGDAVLLVSTALPGVAEALFSAASAAERADLSVAKRVCSELGSKHKAAARAISPGGCAETEAEIDSIVAALDSRFQGVRLLGELSDRTMDEILAAGERLSSLLVGLAASAPCLDARTLIRTDSRFGRARADLPSTSRLVQERLSPILTPGSLIVSQGNLGSDSLGSTTSLGKGGADYSASLFGAALGAREILIWAGDEGIYTSDPELVPEAGTVEMLSFGEAAELVAYGAKTLHPATIRPALEARIPVTVRSALKPEGGYTTISPSESSGKAVAALAMRKRVAVITLRQELMTDQPGFLARIFAAFGRLGISVDLVSTSEVCVSVSLDMASPLERAAAELAELGKVEIARDRAVLALVGSRLKESPEIYALAFEALRGIGIDMLSMGAEGINLSIVVAEGDADSAMRRLHRAFFGPAAGSAGGASP